MAHPITGTKSLGGRLAQPGGRAASLIASWYREEREREEREGGGPIRKRRFTPFLTILQQHERGLEASAAMQEYPACPFPAW